MTEPTPAVDGNHGEGPDEQPGPIVRDRRRLDPETGEVRKAYAAHGAAPATDPPPAPAGATDPASVPAGAGEPLPAGAGEPLPGEGDVWGPPGEGGDKALLLAEERLADLQRLQAEYVNYRRRVERDRDVAREAAVAGVLEALLPVLDDVHLARRHGDLEGGPFAAIAEKLETTLSRLGLTRYGEPGETFDPTVHEALMHTRAELAAGTSEPTVVEVLQPGYRAGERVLRPARVAVADPPG